MTVIVVGLQLVGGITPQQGRLEIFHEGAWGKICNTYTRDIEAGLACRELGLG